MAVWVCKVQRLCRAAVAFVTGCSNVCDHTDQRQNLKRDCRHVAQARSCVLWWTRRCSDSNHACATRLESSGVLASTKPCRLLLCFVTIGNCKSKLSFTNHAQLIQSEDTQQVCLENPRLTFNAVLWELTFCGKQARCCALDRELILASQTDTHESNCRYSQMPCSLLVS